MNVSNKTHKEIATEFLTQPGIHLYDPEGRRKQLEQLFDDVAERAVNAPKGEINLADGVSNTEAALAGTALNRRRAKSTKTKGAAATRKPSKKAK